MRLRRTVARMIACVPLALLLAHCRSVTAAPEQADVRKGHLLIVGGGPIPPEVLRRFVELAGGSGRARIALFPMASQSEQAGIELAGDFRKMGARAERLVFRREEAERPETASRLEGVTGVWFGGGDQSRLTAAIGGTPLEEAIRRRYREGAVIGGSSAGAAVMSEVMITGRSGVRAAPGPLGSRRRFHHDRARKHRDLPASGAARRRHRGPALRPASPAQPAGQPRARETRLVGIGIDESTAAEVSPQGWWTVLGESVLVIYDARKARAAAGAPSLGASSVLMHVLPRERPYHPASGQVR
ncbi:MAG: cyanophycinase [Thermoanaerobaculia bacterium]